MTFSWWPFLYEWNFLMAYSVYIPPMFNLFSLSTTSSGPNSYTSDFNGLFHLLLPGELFLTWQCLWLHVYVPLVTYSEHVPPHSNSSWPSFYTIDFHGLFCIFTSHCRVDPHIFYGYMCTYFLWPILYTYLLLGTYSLHIPPLDNLIYTQGTFSWPIL